MKYSFFPTSIKLPFKTLDDGSFYVYDTVTNDSDKMLELFYILNDFFQDDKNQEKRIEYYTTLWEWYVFLFWETIKFLDKKLVVDIFTHQLVDATQLGLDVYQKMFQAISNITPDPEEMQSFYSSIKKELENCTEKIVTSRGFSEYSIKDIYDKKIFFKQKKDLDLDYAEFKTKIHDNIFFSIRNEKYRFFETDKSLNLFFNILNFFIDIEPQQINEFIFSFDHKADILREQNSEGEDVFERSFEDDNSENEVMTNNYFDENGEKEKELPISVKLDYTIIKLQLEQEFSYDKDGELAPIEVVLGRLSELAEENNDEQINELYIFDEEKGKFVWNEELLNQI